MRTRDTYIRKIKARLERTDAQLRQLEAERAEAAADVKIVYGLRLTLLRERRDHLECTLDRLDGSNSGASVGVRQKTDDRKLDEPVAESDATVG